MHRISRRWFLKSGASLALSIAPPPAYAYPLEFLWKLKYGPAPLVTSPINLPGFDPSIADTPAATRAWMAYSAVAPSPQWPLGNTRTVTTRLAYSDDAGKTWTDAGLIVNPISEVAGDPAQRTWINEVPTLVRVAASDWRLFWHHYATSAGIGQFQNGWIAYKAASTPEGLAAAPEIKLFGADGYDAANNTQGGSTGSPVGGAPRITTAGLGLTDCAVLSEPGAMETGGNIFLAVGAFGTADRVTLWVCPSAADIEQTASWSVLGTVVTEADAALFTAINLSASALFMNGANAYIAVSPIRNTPVPGALNGCYVLQFSNLGTATILRDSGTPRRIKQIEGTPGSFNGCGTYAQNVTAAGFVFGEISFAAAGPVFKLFKTGQLLL